jgi:hypothetical protein
MTTVYQDWFNQCMQRCVEDGNRVFADVQKLIRTGSRLTQNGKAAANQAANRFGLRAARQINHWRRHGASAFGEKMSE